MTIAPGYIKKNYMDLYSIIFSYKELYSYSLLFLNMANNGRIFTVRIIGGNAFGNSIAELYRFYIGECIISIHSLTVKSGGWSAKVKRAINIYGSYSCIVSTSCFEGMKKTPYCIVLYIHSKSLSNNAVLFGFGISPVAFHPNSSQRPAQGLERYKLTSWTPSVSWMVEGKRPQGPPQPGKKKTCLWCWQAWLTRLHKEPLEMS